MNVPSLGNLPDSLELVGFSCGRDNELAIVEGNVCTAVGEFGGDVLVRVRSVLRLDNNGVRTTCRSRVNGNDGFELGLGSVQSRGVSVVGCHFE